MNADFDLTSAIGGGRQLGFKDLMQVMKDQSAGKSTIQALSDKLMLHQMLDNIGVPQLPILLAVEGNASQAKLAADVARFVHEHLWAPENPKVIAKPTHQSNATGVLVLSKPPPTEIHACQQYITQHIQAFMAQKAGAHESHALRSLRPGFVCQPMYQSLVGFKTPLELRVVCLWGKARVALWWWGRNVGPNESPQRNAWLVRRPAKEGDLGPNDKWEVLHNHGGRNPGFERALELFQWHIGAVAEVAETVATAFGAPFLRSDFFVGDPKWGVRLNEVAYGCGCDYRNLAGDGSGRIVDDSLAIAQILQEGMRLCQQTYAPEHFLENLGARGGSYFDMTVCPLPPWSRRRPAPCVQLEGSYLPPKHLEEPVTEDLCNTMSSTPCISVIPSMPSLIPPPRLMLPTARSFELLRHGPFGDPVVPIGHRRSLSFA